jgi:hypothetical protein
MKTYPIKIESRVIFEMDILKFQVFFNVQFSDKSDDLGRFQNLFSKVHSNPEQGFVTLCFSLRYAVTL